MRAIVLGTAAGGGSPQWNCACAVCALIRAGQPGTCRRTQDSLAISGDGLAWYLVNASPDVCAQLEQVPSLLPRSGRATPIVGVVLTDAEVDHALGLALLREADRLEVVAPSAVLTLVREELSVGRILDTRVMVRWVVAEPGVPMPLGDRIVATPIPMSAKRPSYAVAAAANGDPPVVGYRFEDRITGGSIVYLPCVARWTSQLDEAIDYADLALIDGTFWTNDELIDAKVSPRSARDLGHVPIHGPDGSASRVADLSGTRVRYTHVNNTNPALVERSPERWWLQSIGLDIATEREEFDL